MDIHDTVGDLLGVPHNVQQSHTRTAEIVLCRLHSAPLYCIFEVAKYQGTFMVKETRLAPFQGFGNHQRQSIRKRVNLDVICRSN